ncbi:MAG: hypothetical protein JO158_02760 [Gammaproteobacteria bacterium]|nr:hypothetical protein [Gammaproteobacteria bacterium]MBV9724946.1 hypothetical protein [Gammaproteobacteria bacterium]
MNRYDDGQGSCEPESDSGLTAAWVAGWQTISVEPAAVDPYYVDGDGELIDLCSEQALILSRPEQERKKWI